MKLCPIFCLNKDIEIDELSEMINWAYDNKNSKTVLILDETHVAYYQKQGLWQIIAQETDDWLFGLYEDDWIFDFKIMQNIIHSIKQSDIAIDDNIDKILFLLKGKIKKMTWKKLLDISNDDISRGSLIKFNGEYPFEQQVVMMFCAMPSDLGKFGLITITGSKSGINPYFVFPNEIVDKNKIKDWLVDNWHSFSLNNNIESVLVRGRLNYTEL